MAQFIKQQTTIGELFRSPTSPRAPQEISTLYRWFKRLIIRCKSLLPLLKKELLNLIPQTDLTELEAIILAKNIDSPYHICRASWLLSEKLLQVSSELLQSEISLTPLTFLKLLLLAKHWKTPSGSAAAQTWLAPKKTTQAGMVILVLFYYILPSCGTETILTTNIRRQQWTNTNANRLPCFAMG